MVRFEDCESLFTYLKTEKMIAEKYLVHHFLSTQRAPEEGDLGNAYWLPESENPADRLTRLRGDMVSFLTHLESGRCYPGQLRPLTSAFWRERMAHVTHSNSSRMRTFGVGQIRVGWVNEVYLRMLLCWPQRSLACRPF